MRTYCLLTLVLYEVCLEVSGTKLVEIITTGLVSNATGNSLHNLGPAFDAGAAHFQLEHGQNFTLKHTYLLNASILNCPDLASQTSLMLSEWYYKQRTPADIYAFISPVCLEFAEANRLLTNWDILMIATASDDTALRNKVITPASISLSAGTADSIVGMYVTVLTYFNWTNVVIVFDQSALAGYHALVGTIVPFLRESGCQVTMFRVASKTSMNFTKELNDFKLIGRILLYFGHAQPFRQLLIQAKLSGLCTGEFVYIAFNVYKQKSVGTLTWQYGDENDTVAREAFRSALLLGPDVSIYTLPNWTSVSELTTGYVSAFNITYPSLDPPIPIIASVIQAFLVLGQVLEETFRETEMPGKYRGRQLARKVFSRRFDLGFTETVVDKFGQRMIHEELSDMDPITGNFKPCLQLQFTQPKTVLKLADFDWGGPANSSNTIPLNEPVCGYHGDRGPCARGFLLLRSSEIAVLGTILPAAVLSFCSVLYCYSKKNRTLDDFMIEECEIKIEILSKTAINRSRNYPQTMRS